MNQFKILGKILLLLFLAGASLVCVAQEKLPWIVGKGSPHDLQQLSWLNGSWMAKVDSVDVQRQVDERWSLHGASLLGISRTMVGEQSQSVEMLMLERLGDIWVMRLRFFGPAIDTAVRGKDEPLRLQLVEADDQHFRCEGIGSEAGTTLIYQKLPSTMLQANVSKTREGKIVWQESYLFHRN